MLHKLYYDLYCIGLIVYILHQLNTEGTTIVMVTHDENIANKTGRVIRLLDGTLI